MYIDMGEYLVKMVMVLNEQYIKKGQNNLLCYDNAASIKGYWSTPGKLP
jgi:hypothetical protein